MQKSTLLLAGLAGLSFAQDIIRGFNSGGIGPNGVKSQQDFEAEFNKMKNLPGTSGFTSARLFTTIQANTANDPTLAIPAAISTKTSLLLGLWASAGQDAFNQELTALRRAVDQYGQAFTDLIVGISVGSEDLYRVTPTGIANQAGIGSSPDELVKYIQQTRDKLDGHDDLKKKIGHVDTWTAWINATNFPVTAAVDWIGMDGYPYYETVNDNTIDNAGNLFFVSYNTTLTVSQGKPVWITETGWPVAGPKSGAADATVDNAKKYWDAVACRLLGNVNTWWFTMDDTKKDPNEISFSVLKPGLGDPLFDLAC
ncbi:glycoside hydrolase family 17 protein [Sphaerulina musiva SO2202]|uniref:glucan endo-1,3-beta-D-glucosidase n=1 Tax=Sphaerulina musiva (strain SO2202) TaxID=692275 RepID=M3CYG3_SPHMS|nr:glycoside hydrolase family 17 protein [Sphaerulina musiva SO2202]EMF08721.1 glycoside hydrolase family 17 protein [Sphaerulina musiva SO2202]